MTDALPDPADTAATARGWFATPSEITGRRAHLRRLADAGRLVIERMATTDVADDVIERAAELLEAAARELDGPGRVRRYEGFAESANAGGDPSPHFDHSPIFGMASPLAPPTNVQIGEDGRSVELHVRYNGAYEGPPGSVHGGVVAGMFDEVLGMTQSLTGQPGMTGTLRIRYRQPTPLHRDLRFVGTLDRVEGRKIFTTGRCFADDVLTAEAEGLFIRVDFQRLVDMLATRDETPG